MRTTRQLSITLPTEMADMIQAKVASGEYASESEVIRDGLRAMMARDQAIEDWLRTEVVAADDALDADPASGLSLEEVRARLAAQRQKPR